MPIEGVSGFPIATQTLFDEVDRQVMRHAFASHNCLGRLCDEGVHENDLASRLRTETRFEVATQAPVTASHGEFSKTYRLDLVVEGIVYELKSVRALTADHEAQALHYAALIDAGLIKLVNFGGPRVEGQLLRCPFGRMDRRAVTIDTSAWSPIAAECRRLVAIAESCVRDWGGFLSPRLIAELLTFNFGGPDQAVRRLPVTRAGQPLGHHRTSLHADDVAFVVTALGSGAQAYGAQLKRLLTVLPIRGWQWINLKNTHLTFTTLKRS